MNESTQIKWGLILTYVAQFVSLASGLIYTPIMLRLLGQSEYGLYNLSASVITYLGVLNFGFANGYLRLYFRYKREGEDLEIAKLNGMFLLIFIFVSIIVALCGYVIIHNIKQVFADGLTSTNLAKSRILMMIMTVNLIITFISSVFDCYLSANNQFIFQRGLQVLKSLFSPFISIPLLLLGYGSVGLTVVTTVLTFTTFTISVVFCIRKLKMKFIYGGLELSKLKELSIFTFYIFLSTVVDKINLSLDNFLLGRLVNTSSVAIYGVGAQINGFYYMISTSIATVFSPKINSLVSIGDSKSITDFFIKISQILFLALGIALLIFLFFGVQLIDYWAGSDYSQSYYVALILMVGCFIQLFQICGIEIQKAMNQHKARSIVYFIVAILNIFISIPLIKHYEAIGASIGTLITMVLGSGIFMNYYYHYKMKLDMARYWKEIGRLFPLFTPSIFIGLLYLWILPHNIFTLIISVSLFLIIFLLCVNKFLKNIGITYIENVIKRLIRKQTI